MCSMDTPKYSENKGKILIFYKTSCIQSKRCVSKCFSSRRNSGERVRNNMNVLRWHVKILCVEISKHLCVGNHIISAREHPAYKKLFARKCGCARGRYTSRAQIKRVNHLRPKRILKRSERIESPSKRRP